MDPALIAFRTHGWAHLSWWDGQDANELNVHYPELFEEAPLQQNREALRPLDKDQAKAGTMSSFTGLGRQPPHTDKAHEVEPPQYVVLRCDTAGHEPCPTILWSLDWCALERAPPSLLTDPNWVIRRSLVRQFYGQVISFGSDRVGRARFDPLCMSLPGRSDAAKIALERLLYNANQMNFYWKKGDTLLINNWRVLHARGSVGMDARSRKLSRWISGGRSGMGN